MTGGGLAESIGWGDLVALGGALLTAALGYGASNQRNKRTADDVEKLDRRTTQDVEKLEKEHGERIAAVREVADRAHAALADYKLAAVKDFVSEGRLRETEGRLTNAITSLKDDVASKVDSIKTDMRDELSKRQIGHAVRDAIAAVLAEGTLEAKGKLPK